MIISSLGLRVEVIKNFQTCRVQKCHWLTFGWVKERVPSAGRKGYNNVVTIFQYQSLWQNLSENHAQKLTHCRTRFKTLYCFIRTVIQSTVPIKTSASFTFKLFKALAGHGMSLFHAIEVTNLSFRENMSDLKMSSVLKLWWLKKVHKWSLENVTSFLNFYNTQACACKYSENCLFKLCAICLYQLNRSSKMS
jgi:hypothetical protein